MFLFIIEMTLIFCDSNQSIKVCKMHTTCVNLTTFVFVNTIEVTPNIIYGKNKMSSQSLSNTTHKTKLPSVRITSPVRGQEVPVGKTLVVSGISASKSSNCAVSVTVNGINLQVSLDSQTLCCSRPKMPALQVHEVALMYVHG
jgi:hypothetical protein